MKTMIALVLLVKIGPDEKTALLLRKRGGFWFNGEDTVAPDPLAGRVGFPVFESDWTNGLDEQALLKLVNRQLRLRTSALDVLIQPQNFATNTCSEEEWEVIFSSGIVRTENQLAGLLTSFEMWEVVTADILPALSFKSKEEEMLVNNFFSNLSVA